MSVWHYQGGEGRAYHQGKRALPPAALPWLIRLRAEKFAPRIRSTDTVLEYGVGPGWNLAGLACARKIGIDVSELVADPARQHGIEFHFSSESLPHAVADVVICHHMLEHALAPAQILTEILRLLKPSGRLILHVPLEPRVLKSHFNPTEPNHHLYSWTVQTLGNLLSDSGFCLETIGPQRFAYDRAAAVAALRLKLGERGYRFLRGLAQRLRPEYEIAVIARPADESHAR